MRLACHQPNFFPWGCYFDKIRECDLFVIMLNCQFEKNNFQNRFNIGDKWYTMGVNHKIQTIKDKKYSNPIEDFDKIKRRLPQYKSILNSFDDCISDNLGQTNIKIIKRICFLLDIKTPITIDFPTKKTSTERLIEICQQNKADSYICGESGINYMNFQFFTDNNIKIEKFSNKHQSKKPILEILNEII